LETYQTLLREQQTLEQRPDITPPLLTGADLIALGMQPGPAMGALLTEARDKQLQEELRTPDGARHWAAARLKELGIPQTPAIRRGE
jgi:poly(A) polymerase